MRLVMACLLAAVCGGCGDDSGVPPGDAGVDGPSPDGAVDGPAIDAPAIDAAPSDALMTFGDGGHCVATGDAAAGAGTHTIYLNFEGADLIADPSGNDARTGHTFLINSNKTVPPFLNGVANRDTFINTIVATVTQQLAPYDVQVVTMRPASGEFMMVVFGGASQDIIGQGNVGSFGPLDCGNLSNDDIMFVFDAMLDVPLANAAMFTIGIAIGLSTTSLPGDCLSVSTATAVCTLSGSAPISPSTGACPNAAPNQDELSAFTAVFGCK
jgi:hypothetical protein